MRTLCPAYAHFDHFYVLNDVALLPPDMQERTRFIVHSERDLKFFINLWEAFCILRRERPHVILSTGAGPVVPFAIVGRLFFRCRVIFIETITRIDAPSMTGRIMYWLAHDFYFQWPHLQKFFPKGRYGGLLL